MAFVAVPATGADVLYTAPSNGSLTVHMWGGGGGSALLYDQASPNGPHGGGAGYTTVQFSVAAGDVIKFQTAKGGKKAVANTSAAGGWPDGGASGNSGMVYAVGGGGGSSRVWRNTTLVAVAAGGGGCGGSNINGKPGSAGGLVGQDAQTGIVGRGTGGSQTAGGVNASQPAVTTYQGGYLKGGNGTNQASPATVTSTSAGGGGGGGYYGGGGGGGTTSNTQAGGGGGSSYVNTAMSGYISGSMQEGSVAAVPANDDPGGQAVAQYPGAPIGVGGQSVLSGGTTNTDGGDGYITYEFTSTGGNIPVTPFNKQVINTSGARRAYIPSKAGNLVVKLWGGGGGGAVLPNSSGIQNEPGATGGYTTVVIPVTAGQLVEFEVGDGGQGAQWFAGQNDLSGANGGFGGFPDGGNGGYNRGASAQTGAAAGGGGGSTRLWIDNVLYAVAAGGGGSGCTQADRRPGAGGGLVGQDALAVGVAAWANMRGMGGTQTAGGANVSNAGVAQMQGGSLRGGHGYPAADGRTVSTTAANMGGGGGGGYYGGSGGGPSALGGGGGSSYIKSGLTGSTEGGNYYIAPGGAGDADYIAGTGVGGTSAASTTVIANAGNGGPGRAVVTLLAAEDLSTTQTTAVVAQSAAREYKATAAGTLEVKLWGAGGGGGVTTNNFTDTRNGGAGGYTTVNIPVVIGDIIKVEVGSGGRRAASSTDAGLGGWPDGGWGGVGSAAGYAGGGGGGSTRVYKNSVLQAVAGAGGGGDGNVGGTGGGLTGGSQGNGPGGSQTAGGSAGTSSGALLQGGNSGNRTGTGLSTAGGGGGGGYYGGGGYNIGGNNYGGGGGGSGYVRTGLTGSTASATTIAPIGSVPPVTSGAPTGTSIGGATGRSVATNNANGGDGHATIAYYDQLALNTPKTTVYSGASRSYLATASGKLNVKLWAAGGGGGTMHESFLANVSRGGSGGQVTASVMVASGDVVTVEVGEGGKYSNIPLGRGGYGGYPDGGDGGWNGTNPGACFGGGGGSSRLYVNGVLKMVAGSGGGNGWGQNYAGSGGGLTGGTFPGNATSGLGGTQIAGGDYGGSYLNGGDARTVREVTGGGGGGGYYGGGASRGLFGAGGGGSSWTASDVTDVVHLQGVEGVAPVDADRPAGVAEGGLGYSHNTANVPTNGGNGGARLTIVPNTMVAGTTATANFSGKSVEYIMASAGDLTVNLWGGGGGGSTDTITGRTCYGGAGGWVHFTVPVLANDIIKVEVGQGGQIAPAAMVRPPVAYPDGGEGSVWSAGYYAGGGGGSTRVYKNGVLQAVGGGGGAGTINNNGGSGGAPNAGSALYGGASGGSQTSPGVVSGAPHRIASAAFQGGAAPDDTSAGGGGGGGYYGGAAGTGGSAFHGGAGGSSYLIGAINDGGANLAEPPVLSGSPATRPVPGGNSFKPATTIGQGGTSGVAQGTQTPGGNGAVVMSLIGAQPPIGIDMASVHVAPTAVQKSQSYVANVAGALDVKAWGAGGGGGVTFSSLVTANDRAGGGGFTKGYIVVAAGDVVTVEVGRGGRRGPNLTEAKGGLGGWPDGGNAAQALYNGYYSNGGGGGSTRIYVNGTLKMVAGAGGGGARGYAGGGGGLTGGDAGPGYLGGTAATGGTQTTGGVNGGGYLKGGNGNAAPDYNAGGGGGYYGGGAYQQGSPSLNAGGGGSSFIAADVVSGATVAALSSYVGAAAGTTDPHYVAGVGQGGRTNRDNDGSNTDGGNGLVRLELKPLSVLAGQYTPVTATGSDVNLTVTTAGYMFLKMWGGGGGGSVGFDSSSSGAGGFTYIKMIVQVGDVVKLQTAMPGNKGVSGGNAAAAWPDGGRPGRTSNADVGFGSGGGSSRVWLNGVLMAVAGGGGASGASAANGRPGAGGGATGQNGGSTLGYGLGGSQTAGGTNFSSPTNTFFAGAYLQGGMGTNVADPTTATFWAGGGGGGGYYGGAGGGYYGGTSGTIYYPGGGGGSGYLNTTNSRFVEGTTTAGNVGVTAGKTDDQYPGNVGDGGSNTGSFATHTNGQPGYIGYKYEAALIADLQGTITLTPPVGGPDDPVLRGYRGSGQPVLYTVTTAGNLIAGLWGAGGAGGFRATNVSNIRGGGAGFTYIEYPVQVGDVVKLEVGVGGGSALPSGGGLGGWPDGGDGGLYTANGATGTGGGGGGSTRLWVNSTLVAVAAAGGGGFSGLNDGFSLPNYGGHGGGLTGGVGVGTNAGTIQGATQTAGGTNPVRPAQNGGTLNGGDARGATVSTSTIEAGGGGGGGYYGGAGGGSRTNNATAYSGAGGSGGSSFIHPNAHYGFTLSGADREPGGLDHPLRVDNTGRGSLGSTMAEGGSLPGQDGYGVFGVSPASSGIANGAAFDNAIVFTNDIKIDTIGEGEIGTLVWFAELGGTGSLEAVINIPFVDYALEFSPETATVAAGVDAIRAIPGPIAFTTPMGSGASAYEAVVDLSPLVLTLDRVTGYAEDGLIVSPIDQLPAITLFAPDGMAGQVGSAGYATGLLDVTIALGDPNAPTATVANAHTLDPLKNPISIFLTAPVGNPSTPDMETDGLPFDNDLVFTQAPDAIAEDGVVAPADLSAFIYTTIETDVGAVNDALAEGNASAIGEDGFEGYVLDGNGVPYFVRALELIPFTPPQGRPSAGATVDHSEVLRIVMRTPAVTAKQAADILGSIIPAMISLSSPRGIGGPPNFALAKGDMDNAVLTLQEPHAYADDSARGKIHLLRTLVPGRAPTTLGAREIAINEADGIIYSRDASGKVRPTPIYAIQTGGEMPDGGDPGEFLRGDGTWGAIIPNFDTAIRVPAPITRILLAEKNQQPINTPITTGELRYQPFFISHRTVLTQIGVNVVILGDAFVQMGVCTWVDGAPGTLLTAAMASTNTTGLKMIPGTLSLEPGWYASVVSLSGAGTPIFAGAKVSKTLMPDFTLTGDQIAPQGDLTALTPPTARAADALALMSGTVLE